MIVSRVASTAVNMGSLPTARFALVESLPTERRADVCRVNTTDHPARVNPISRLDVAYEVTTSRQAGNIEAELACLHASTHTTGQLNTKRRGVMPPACVDLCELDGMPAGKASSKADDGWSAHPVQFGAVNAPHTDKERRHADPKDCPVQAITPRSPRCTRATGRRAGLLPRPRPCACRDVGTRGVPARGSVRRGPSCVDTETPRPVCGRPGQWRDDLHDFSRLVSGAEASFRRLSVMNKRNTTNG